MSRVFRSIALVVATALLVPRCGAAQRARIDAVLDSATAATVGRWIDSAAAAGLPVDGITGVALEGASRHAAPARIVAAVTAYVAALVAARDGLGRGASPSELGAGAGAVLSGVDREQLVALRRARPGQSLTIPLVVLADLAARGVPVDTATRSIYVSLIKGARDDELSDLRRQIEQDILAGAPPGSAAVSRLEGLPGVTAAEVRRLWAMTIMSAH